MPMKILVANLGSTSFKYRLFDMTDERQLARGGIERIGCGRKAVAFVEIGSHRDGRSSATVPDHAVAVRQCLEQLTDPNERLPARRRRSGGHRLQGGAWRRVQRRATRHAASAGGDGGDEPGGAGPQSAVRRGHATAEREAAGAFRWWPPSKPAFIRRFPTRQRYYAIPLRMGRRALHVERWGFHGASHRYIADAHRRTARPRAICGSSPATWAARARCVRFATDGAWRPAWA